MQTYTTSQKKKKKLIKLILKVKEEKIEEEKGNYSWGGTAEKVYYSLGENALPRSDERVKAYFDRISIQSGGQK